jgi:hypothetical protein
MRAGRTRSRPILHPWMIDVEGEEVDPKWYDALPWVDTFLGYHRHAECLKRAAAALSSAVGRRGRVPGSPRCTVRSQSFVKQASPWRKRE